MKEMTEAQQKAKALLYEPAYASDKDAATGRPPLRSARDTRTF